MSLMDIGTLQEIEKKTQRRLNEKTNRLEATRFKQTQTEIEREVQLRVDKALKESERKQSLPNKPLVGDNATIIKNFNSLFDTKFKWDGDRET